MSIFDAAGPALHAVEGLRLKKEAEAAKAVAAREQRMLDAGQMVSQVNAEVALKSLMDAELALTKARDLLRRSRGYIMVHTPIDDEGAVALVHGINDLLGD